MAGRAWDPSAQQMQMQACAVQGACALESFPMLSSLYITCMLNCPALQPTHCSSTFHPTESVCSETCKFYVYLFSFLRTSATPDMCNLE